MQHSALTKAVLFVLLTGLVPFAGCASPQAEVLPEGDGGLGCGDDCEVVEAGDEKTAVARFGTRFPTGQATIACRWNGGVGLGSASGQGTRIVNGPYQVNGTEMRLNYSGLGGTITVSVPNTCTLGSYVIRQQR